MAASYDGDSLVDKAASDPETRKDAASALGAVSSAVNPRSGVGQKLAIAGAVYRLARRYPVPTLVVGGIALAIYMSRRHSYERRHAYEHVTRH